MIAKSFLMFHDASTKVRTQSTHNFVDTSVFSKSEVGTA